MRHSLMLDDEVSVTHYDGGDDPSDKPTLKFVDHRTGEEVEIWVSEIKDLIDMVLQYGGV